MTAFALIAAPIACSVVGAAVLCRHLDLSRSSLLWTIIAVLVPLIATEPARRRLPGLPGPATWVTLGRATLISILAVLVGPRPDETVAWVAAVAAIVALCLDGVDGWLARKTQTESDYGALLDMEVDSIFMMLLCTLVLSWGYAGAWVLFCGLARYLWLLTMALIPWFRRSLEPAFRRKAACVVGIAGLALALPPWPWGILNGLAASGATLALAASFAIDIVWLIQRRHEPLETDSTSH